MELRNSKNTPGGAGVEDTSQGDREVIKPKGPVDDAVLMNPVQENTLQGPGQEQEDKGSGSWWTTNRARGREEEVVGLELSLAGAPCVGLGWANSQNSAQAGAI